ncbi:MAG: hypothetical protein RL732_708 [Bacteroidota bacterium]
MRVYFISGLGADRRAFRNIKLPQGFEAVYLDWFSPYQEETLEAYAKRMSAGIDQRQPFALIGLSMGGMVAVEISKISKPAILILISSIPRSSCLPAIYRWAGAMGMHRCIPINWLKSGMLLKRFFMVESLPDREQIIAMVKQADPLFIRWALRAILRWRNTGVPQTYFHIHGDQDEIFPIHHVQPTHIVRGGKHLMVLNHAADVNKYLAEILATPTVK